MKINQIDGQLCKISKSSITVKGDDGKTKGVVTQCYELASRDASSIWGKVRSAVGLDATKCISNMRKIGNEIFYLCNINTPDENAGKLADAGITVIRYRKLA